jgi:hypothetical protein
VNLFAILIFSHKKSPDIKPGLLTQTVYFTVRLLQW